MVRPALLRDFVAREDTNAHAPSRRSSPLFCASGGGWCARPSFATSSLGRIQTLTPHLAVARLYSARAEADGAPGRSRTCDPRFRKPVLYPAELRARANM